MHTIKLILKLSGFIGFLILIPGLCSPLTWSELQEPVFTPRRDDEGRQIYLQRLEQLKDLKKAPETAILEDVFGMSPEKAEACSKDPCPLQYRLTINSFPYHLEANAVHLLVFSTRNNWDRNTLFRQSESLLIEAIPEITNKSRYDYIIRVNIPKNRTVSGLAHTHIFIRDKSRTPNIHQRIAHLPFSFPHQPPTSWPLIPQQ